MQCVCFLLIIEEGANNSGGHAVFGLNQEISGHTSISGKDFLNSHFAGLNIYTVLL